MIKSQVFAAGAVIDFRAFFMNKQIIVKLFRKQWPMDDKKIRKHVFRFVAYHRQQLAECAPEKQLAYMEPLVFDVRSRMYAIDELLKASPSSCYGLEGYEDLKDKTQRLSMLGSTKLSCLSKLPRCKIVRVVAPKLGSGHCFFSVSMPIDKVLQKIFLIYLDVIIEGTLKPNMFGYRHCRDARMAAASVYAKLSRRNSRDDLRFCSLDLGQYWGSLCHSQILERFPFPVTFKFLLNRWLKGHVLEQCSHLKDLGVNRLGILQGSILGSVIGNYILSRAFPTDIFMQQGSRKK